MSRRSRKNGENFYCKMFVFANWSIILVLMCQNVLPLIYSRWRSMNVQTEAERHDTTRETRWRWMAQMEKELIWLLQELLLLEEGFGVCVPQTVGAAGVRCPEWASHGLTTCSGCRCLNVWSPGVSHIQIFSKLLETWKIALCAASLRREPNLLWCNTWRHHWPLPISCTAQNPLGLRLTKRDVTPSSCVGSDSFVVKIKRHPWSFVVFVFPLQQLILTLHSDYLGPKCIYLANMTMFPPMKRKKKSQPVHISISTACFPALVKKPGCC